MSSERYNFETLDNCFEFSFYSEGPKGRIKKVVRYTPQYTNGMTYFNLGFGDMDDEENEINDLAISNNHDRDKILSTVAATVLVFTDHFPNVMIYAKGSTPARTRLYQIGIVANWEKIDPLLNVLGYTEDNGWEKFVKNFNYEAFMVFRK